MVIDEFRDLEWPCAGEVLILVETGGGGEI